MSRFLLLVFFALVFGVQAQVPSTGLAGTNAIGTRDISFTDSSLATPSVAARVWYPATTPGAGTTVAIGLFPVLGFGHGFNLSFLDYSQICGHLASWGYIVVSPNVQNGFNADHLEFARELAACIRYMQSEGNNFTSGFYGRIANMSGVFGHSMGGGAAALVPTIFPNIDAVGSLAGAETTPSCISVLSTFSGPFQVISGTADNTAPENTNQIPMYNAVPGLKHHVSIQGGAHCKFTDASTACDLVSSAGTVTRPFQIYLSKKYLTAFFNYALKFDANGLVFLCGDSILAQQTAGDIAFSTTFNCGTVGSSAEDPNEAWIVSPNPFTARIRVNGDGSFIIWNAVGQKVFSGEAQPHSPAEFSLETLAPGMYFLRSPESNTTIRLLKL